MNEVLIHIREIPPHTNPDWDSNMATVWDKESGHGRAWKLHSPFSIEFSTKDECAHVLEGYVWAHNKWSWYQLKVEGKEFGEPFAAPTLTDLIEEVWYRVDLYRSFYD